MVSAAGLREKDILKLEIVCYVKIANFAAKNVVYHKQSNSFQITDFII